MAQIQREPYTLNLLDVPMVNTQQLDRLAEQIDKSIYRKPVNASINDSGGIVKEIAGVRLNRRAFLDQFYAQFYAEGPMKVELPLQPCIPK